MTGSNCKNHWSWLLISPSLTLSISCQSSLPITVCVHSLSVNSTLNSSPYCYFFVAILHPSIPTGTSSSAHHFSVNAKFKLVHHSGLFLPYLPNLTIFAHTVHQFFYCVIGCKFVYPICNSVLLFLSHWFALSWPDRGCKWELVLISPTRLNNGEIKINKYKSTQELLTKTTLNIPEWPSYSI
jgi:hypothetical protein